MTHPDDEVPDDFRPTNLEMLGETGCPGCDALIAKMKEFAEMALGPIAIAHNAKAIEKLACWLLAEARDEPVELAEGATPASQTLLDDRR